MRSIAQYAHGNVAAAADALRAALCLDPSLWPAGFYLARVRTTGPARERAPQYNRIADEDLHPLALQSVRAVIDELRVPPRLSHRRRRVAAESTARPRRLLK